MPPVTVWVTVNEHEPVMKSCSNLIYRINRVLKPEVAIITEELQLAGDTIRIDPNIFS